MPWTLHFASPGAFSGTDVSLSGGEWALLVFDGVDAAIRLPVERDSEVTNTTVFHPLRIHEEDSRNNVLPPQELTEGRMLPAGAGITLAAVSNRPSSLYLQAESLGLNLSRSTGSILEKPEARGVHAFSREQDRWRELHRGHVPPGSHAVVTLGDPDGMDFELRAEGVQWTEWYDVEPDCLASSWCPEGGGRERQQFPSMGGQNATSDRLSYESLHGIDHVEGRGTVSHIVFGGRRIHVEIGQGSIRLPLAKGTEACTGCLAPDNQSVIAEGRLVLDGLQRDPGGGLRVGVGGQVNAARFDETVVDPRLLGLGVAGSVAAAAGFALLAKLLLGFFTRLRDDAVLDHPRRRLVYETVAANPGVGFRELTRLTDLSYGVVRHHLDFLLRHDRIVEHRQGPFVHFFGRHDKSAKDWQQVSMLNDARLSQLHDWLAGNPGQAQQAVIAAMATKGWSRSATQRALERLMGAGLVRQTRRGRSVLYDATRRPG